MQLGEKTCSNVTKKRRTLTRKRREARRGGGGKEEEDKDGMGHSASLTLNPVGHH